MSTADKLIELFNEAKAKPAGIERERFVAESCAEDSELREQILSLLKAEEDEGDSDFLRRRALIRQTALLTEKPGDRIGRYKLLQQLGEGGCGVVYMAEQEEPVRRRVALKVIKLGMDTKSVIARFEAERQALAMMDHPNIAKIFDAGTTDASESGIANHKSQIHGGRPFFVMELVRGIKITDYCDQENLSTEQRLELFTQVCHAVQHAHQKGIIHRDLKPSNILVTLHDGVPVPKVIDFGIAKATSGQRLTDKTVFTAFEQFMGTPAYMSPEQAEMSGLDIDTRSDIYSLGVLLYELLTGRTPLDAEELGRSGMDEMRRRIRDTEPPCPSTRLSTMQAGDLKAIAEHRGADAPGLIHLLRGDLDWIVMKCLEKDRTRRYETANGVAADIQRHLHCEPIVARPPSRWYEFQKTIRRHKVGFAAAAAVMVALGLGVIGSTIQAVRAGRAEREQSRLRSVAESKEKKSQEVAQFLKEMLKGVGPDVALGRDTKLLKGILDQTATRLSGLTNEPEVEADLRQTLGTVYRDLSDYSNSLTMLERALRIQTNLHGPRTPAVASVLNDLGQALHRAKRPAEAEACYRQALAMQKQLWGDENLDVASTLDNLGSVLRNERKLKEAEATLRNALSIRKRLLPRKHADISESLANLGLALDAQGKLEEAEQCLEEAFALRKEMLPSDHPRVADALVQLGATQARRGNYAQAERNLQEALASQKKVLGEHRDTALTLHRLGSLLADQQRLPEAEQCLREALVIESKVFGDGTPDVTKLIQVMVSQRKLDEIRNLLSDNLTEDGPAGAKAWSQLAVALWDSGKTAEAGPAYRQALEIQKRLHGPHSPEIVSALLNVSMQLVSQKNWTEAESTAREALAILRTAGIEDRRLYLTLARVAQALVPQGKLSDAESFYREAILLDKKHQFGSRDHWVQAYYVHLQFARLLQKDKRDREASDHLSQAVFFGQKLGGANLAESAHELAKLLITSVDSTLRAPSNAVVYAEQAVSVSNRKNPAFLATLAAAHAEAGDFVTAATVQREAIALLQSESEKQDFAARLKLYESNSAAHEPRRN